MYIDCLNVFEKIVKFKKTVYSKTDTCSQVKCIQIYDQYTAIEHGKRFAMFAIFDEKRSNSEKKTIR